eukprot:3607269-Pleurochrysis_carterae.AAC.1
MRRARAHFFGTGRAPAGCSRVRSCGWCATEKEAQGGAANTAWKCRAATHCITRSATAGAVRSWSFPPTAMSSVLTSTPCARSSDASVDGALPSPANTMSACSGVCAWVLSVRGVAVSPFPPASPAAPPGCPRAPWTGAPASPKQGAASRVGAPGATAAVRPSPVVAVVGPVVLVSAHPTPSDSPPGPPRPPVPSPVRAAVAAPRSRL